MTEQNKPGQLTDQLIREALARDFESVEIPPAERSWRQIEAGLQGSAKQIKSPGANRARYAALAAAVLLVIALSSVGIIQMTDLASLVAEDEAPLSTADDKMEALQADRAEEVEKEESAIAVFTEEEPLAEKPLFGIEADPSPPDWQEVLPDNLIFKEAVLLSASNGLAYQGAIYAGEEEALLWVKSKIDSEEPVDFIEILGENIQAEADSLEVVNGYIRFEAAGQPGLVWQEEDQNQALIVISGYISIEQLESIAELE